MSVPAARIHLLSLAWAAVVAGLLLMPLGGLPGEAPWLPPAVSAYGDKLVHAALFFVCALLFGRSARAAGRRRPVLVAALIAIAYGGLLEVFQGWFGREMSWGDLAADALGAWIATPRVAWPVRIPR